MLGRWAVGPLVCEGPGVLVSVGQCRRHVTFLLLVREVFISPFLFVCGFTQCLMGSGIL